MLVEVKFTERLPGCVYVYVCESLDVRQAGFVRCSFWGAQGVSRSNTHTHTRSKTIKRVLKEIREQYGERREGPTPFKAEEGVGGPSMRCTRGSHPSIANISLKRRSKGLRPLQGYLPHEGTEGVRTREDSAKALHASSSAISPPLSCARAIRSARMPSTQPTPLPNGRASTASGRSDAAEHACEERIRGGGYADSSLYICIYIYVFFFLSGRFTDCNRFSPEKQKICLSFDTHIEKIERMRT